MHKLCITSTCLNYWSITWECTVQVVFARHWQAQMFQSCPCNLMHVHANNKMSLKFVDLNIYCFGTIIRGCETNSRLWMIINRYKFYLSFTLTFTLFAYSWVLLIVKWYAWSSRHEIVGNSAFTYRVEYLHVLCIISNMLTRFNLFKVVEVFYNFKCHATIWV